MCVGEGGVVVIMVCVGGSGNEVCMEITRCGDGCVGVGVGVCLGCGWLNEFSTSGIVYMLILTMSMSTVCYLNLAKKCGLSEFWKNTFQMFVDCLVWYLWWFHPWCIVRCWHNKTSVIRLLFLNTEYQNLERLNGALDNFSLIPNFFSKKLRFLYH